MDSSSTLSSNEGRQTLKKFFILLVICFVLFCIILGGVSAYIIFASSATLQFWKTYGANIIFIALAALFVFRSFLLIFRIAIANKLKQNQPMEWYPQIRPNLFIEWGIDVIIFLTLFFLVVDKNVLAYSVPFIALFLTIIFYFLGWRTPSNSISEIRRGDWVLVLSTHGSRGGVAIPALRIKWANKNRFSFSEDVLALAVWISPLIIILSVAIWFLKVG